MALSSRPERLARLLLLIMAGLPLADCAHYSPSPARQVGIGSRPRRIRNYCRSNQNGSSARTFRHSQLISLSPSPPMRWRSSQCCRKIRTLRRSVQKSEFTDAQAFAARLLPDPTFQANFDYRLSGPDKFNGYGAQIGFDLNTLRTAAVTRQSGEAQKRQVRLDLAWAEWNTAGQARLLGVRVYELGRQLKLAQDSMESTQSLFDAASPGQLGAATFLRPILTPAARRCSMPG